MAKSELGTKRVCPETGRKFYDLGKTPVISPYTGKVVPIVVAPVRSRPEAAAPAPAPRPAPVEEVEAIVPETADAEFVSLEDAEAEQQGKKPAAAEGAIAAGEEDEVEVDESLDDAAFIEEQEEGDPDVTDIIGDGIEKEEET
ncbi:MAG TPA: TIGR02300 family protein [Pseudolabrys sp.]|nr:TIGR02300 family protein [Pseudolabrys sp.]